MSVYQLHFNTTNNSRFFACYARKEISVFRRSWFHTVRFAEIHNHLRYGNGWSMHSKQSRASLPTIVPFWLTGNWLESRSQIAIHSPKKWFLLFSSIFFQKKSFAFQKEHPLQVSRCICVYVSVCLCVSIAFNNCSLSFFSSNALLDKYMCLCSLQYVWKSFNVNKSMCNRWLV